MLTIKTDLQNRAWLVYILEQFKAINLAEFEIEILTLDDTTSNENIIYYLRESNNELSIYNSNEAIPSRNIHYLRDDLFILENSRSDKFTLKYDLFWNTFVFLSRYEEYLSEENGKNICSYSLNHPRTDKNSFSIPVVNILFNEFEQFIQKHFSRLNFGENQAPVIDLSHDVDYIDKTIQLRLKQTAFNGFNTLKSITNPKKFIRRFSKTLKFAFSNPSYWCFDYWQNLEKDHKKRSTFYVYVKNGKKNFKSWLIDPSYDIKTNMKLQEKLKDLKRDGFDIGLHGSYNSAKDFDTLKEEKKLLEKILGIKIIKTRQHWLNYFEQITPKTHEELFSYDSTIAWNDKIGFRSGCASLYNPYDFEKQKAYDYYIIPQVMMDSNVYDYADDEDIFIKAKDMIERAKDISKTTNISISWHQRVCSSDYNWHKFYEEIIDDI